MTHCDIACINDEELIIFSKWSGCLYGLPKNALYYRNSVWSKVGNESITSYIKIDCQILKELLKPYILWG